MIIIHFVFISSLLCANVSRLKSTVKLFYKWGGRYGTIGTVAMTNARCCLLPSAVASRHDGVVWIHLLTPVVGSRNSRTTAEHTQQECVYATNGRMLWNRAGASIPTEFMKQTFSLPFTLPSPHLSLLSLHPLPSFSFHSLPLEVEPLKSN